MEVTNLLDIHTREELYRWYQENHDKVSDFWLQEGHFIRTGQRIAFICRPEAFPGH